MDSYKKPPYLCEIYSDEWLKFNSLADAADWLHDSDQSDKPISVSGAYTGLLKALKSGKPYKNWYVKQ